MRTPRLIELFIRRVAERVDYPRNGSACATAVWHSVGRRICLLTVATVCAAMGASGWAAGPVTNCTESALVAAISGGGNVTFTTSCSITLSGPIAIVQDTTIDAGQTNVTLLGNGSTRLFSVSSNATLTLVGLTLAGGRSTNGGALFIESDAIARLSNCTLSNNRAAGTNGVPGADGHDSTSGNGGSGKDAEAGQPGFGGAIYNLGELVLEGCKFFTNSASGGDGGAGGNGGNGALNAGNGGQGGAGAVAIGGAIYNLGALSITECTFAYNQALGGKGGAGGDPGQGVFAGRAGDGGGGGLSAGAAVYSTNFVAISASTFNNNSARGGGGAEGGTLENGNGATGLNGAKAFGGAICSGGVGYAVNSTFYADEAVGGGGGDGGPGSYNAGDGGNGGDGIAGAVYNTGQFSLTNCTLSSCSAVGGTNGAAGSGTFSGESGSQGRGLGGSLANVGGTFSLINTILGANTSGGSGHGTFDDLGHNIAFDKTIRLGVASKVGTSPVLGTFGSNGGPTQTLTLLPGSPAVNAGDDSVGLTVDQRGFPRPGPGKPHIDIGATEGQPPIIVTGPTNTAVALGSNAVFTLTVTGDGPFRYMWRFNAEPVPRGTNATLTVTNVTGSSLGLYDVIVSNAYGAVTSTGALLTIISSPSITTNPIDQAVVVGSNATFSVVASGTAPLGYQWKFNTTNSIQGAVSPSLTLTNVQATNAGLYSVVVTNGAGSATSVQAQLTVLPGTVMAPPVLTNQQVAFSFPTQTNFTYVLETKGALTEPQWLPVQTNLGSGTAVGITESVTNGPSRYYRLRIR